MHSPGSVYRIILGHSPQGASCNTYMHQLALRHSPGIPLVIAFTQLSWTLPPRGISCDKVERVSNRGHAERLSVCHELYTYPPPCAVM